MEKNITHSYILKIFLTLFKRVPKIFVYYRRLFMIYWLVMYVTHSQKVYLLSFSDR